MNSLCVYKEKNINKTSNTYKCNLNILSKNKLHMNSRLSAEWLFVDRDLLLIDKEGNLLASEPVLNIRKIVFLEGNDATGNSSPLSKTDNAIMVYPNPTKDILHIEGAEDHTIRIYNTQGLLLKKATGKQINVSNLHTGTYLLQIGTQVVRFIKQ